MIVRFSQEQDKQLNEYAAKYNLTKSQVLMKAFDVLGYIEKGYGIFHCEGDEVVLEDIAEFLKGKGMKINA